MQLRKRGSLPQSFIDSAEAREKAHAEMLEKETNWLEFVSNMRANCAFLEENGSAVDAYGNHVANLPREAMAENWSHEKVAIWFSGKLSEMSDDGWE